MTLWEINESIEAAINEIIDTETGEIIGDTAKLDNLDLLREAKIENIGLYIKNLNAEAAALKAEKENLAARQRIKENRAESLKRYLESNLQGEKFETPKLAITWRRSESVEVNDPGKLPEKFLKQKPPEPDKIGLKAAIKAGETIEGVRLIQKNNMQIK